MLIFNLGFNCKCNPDFYFTQNSGGASVMCKECPPNQTQSSDGFSCVDCGQACTNCPLTTSFLTDTDPNGVATGARKCITCDPETSILFQNTCKSCKPLIFTTNSITQIKDTKCNDASFETHGGIIFEATPGGDPNCYNYLFDQNSGVSWYFNEYLRAAYRSCEPADKRNQTACQNLANMCALTLYMTPTCKGIQIDPCAAYTSLFKGQTENDAIRMPLIYYEQNLDVLKSDYEKNGIKGIYIFFYNLIYSMRC